MDLSRSRHCLSRGFETGPKKQELQQRVSPSAVENILGQESYAEFFKALESHVHNAIPQFIRGDFLLQTAPNGMELVNLTEQKCKFSHHETDPVFYLHHTQIDRLWWLWQQRDDKSRMWQYQGPTANVRLTATEHGDSASLEDILSLGKFGESIKVKTVMSTQTGRLCYRY